MSLKEEVQQAMKEAMKARQTERLECLRLAKGALLLKEKESSEGLTKEAGIGVLRGEVRKRHQSIALYQEHGKDAEVRAAEFEIGVLEEFLPKQLSAQQIEERAVAFLEAHPEMNHAGKLTGALKKELGDQVDGKTLNEVCRKVLG